jgi:archaeal flagellar protein FlaF
MASASLVATAFALIMLIITAYFLVGVVLTTAEVVSTAQTDQINQQEQRVRTAVEIKNTSIETGSAIYMEVENTGSVAISEIKYLDIYTINGTSNPPVYYTQGTGTGTWSQESIEPDIINPGQWDPKEIMNISVSYPGNDPIWIQVTTPNGISDSAYM